MSPLACPTDGELSEFTLGCLPADRLEEVADHLDGCPACSTRLVRIGSRPDPLADAVREAGHVAAYGPDVVTTPTVLRDYRLEDVLGEGGMGTVYRAMHSRLGRPVALKLLTARRRLDPDAAARFEREMRAIGALRHPHIVQATDAGEIDGVPFLVMEYVDGTDFGRLIKGRGPLAPSDACEAARQAALGLHHAHGHGLVHRDVKPSNLMLAADGTVKLLDLGLARLLGSDEPIGSPDAATVTLGAGLTETNMLVGTAGYMAPEQRTDPRAVDARADVYALGRTLDFLLTGSPELPAAGAVPGGLIKVLQRLQAPRPEDRYPTAAVAADALRPWARGHDLGALIGDRRPRSRRRVWVLLAALALVVVGTAVGVGLYLSGPEEAQPIFEPEPAPPAVTQDPPRSGQLGMTAEDAKKLQQQWARYLEQDVAVTDKLDMSLVLIPPGEVVIKNVTTVIITKPYRLGTTEVTRAQFRVFVEATDYRTDSERRGGGKYIKIAATDGKGLRPHERSGADLSWRTPGYAGITDADPVTQVSWNDAVAFCRWLTEREGKTYRLPTVGEATWASRAGETTAQPGDIVGRMDGFRLDEFAWTHRNSPLQPKPVAGRRPNAWGLYDMVGNTAEWCQDRYGQTPGGAHIDYAGPATGMLRVLSGGSYTNQGAHGWLEPNTPDARSSKTGFRVLREP